MRTWFDTLIDRLVRQGEMPLRDTPHYRRRRDRWDLSADQSPEAEVLVFEPIEWMAMR